MNYSIYVICFSFLLVASTPGSELPTDVQNLISKREKAIAEIDRIYVRELEELKVKYTKAGDLDSANAIVSLIEKALVNEVSPLEGEWIYRRTGTNDKGTEYRISGDFLISSAKRFKFTREAGQLVVDFQGKGNMLRFRIIDENTMRGKNYYGNAYEFVRVRK